VTLTDFTRQFYRIFCPNYKSSIQKGFEALEKIDKLKKLAMEGNITQYDYNFHHDTFFLFAKARELMYSNIDAAKIKKFKKLSKEYKLQYPKTYRFYVKLEKERWRLLSFIIKILVRHSKEYRMIDKILFNRLTSHLYMYLYRVAKKRFPKFLNNQAMPVEILFK
jgi:hypothetical protein